MSMKYYTYVGYGLKLPSRKSFKIPEGYENGWDFLEDMNNNGNARVIHPSKDVSYLLAGDSVLHLDPYGEGPDVHEFSPTVKPEWVEGLDDILQELGVQAHSPYTWVYIRMFA